MPSTWANDTIKEFFARVRQITTDKMSHHLAMRKIERDHPLFYSKYLFALDCAPPIAAGVPATSAAGGSAARRVAQKPAPVPPAVTAPTIDPVAEFDGRVRAKMDRGVQRSQAIAQVARADPKLHNAFLIATNHNPHIKKLLRKHARRFGFCCTGFETTGEFIR